MKKIAIQGGLGSNHHLAAKKYFGENININTCQTFDILLKKTKNNEVDFGIIAIENSIVGSIIPNYTLIDENNVFIIGEYLLPIEHKLLVKPNTRFEEIREVYSHPMALLQCKKYFEKYPQISLFEYEDTALAAKMISESNKKELAAIAPEINAELYHLKIIRSDIQTIKNNQTRFIIISRENNYDDNYNKASIKVILDHKKGSLAKFLTKMHECDLNLTDIKSMPIRDEPWKYSFFIDFVFDKEDTYLEGINKLKKQASIKILGIYKKSE